MSSRHCGWRIAEGFLISCKITKWRLDEVRYHYETRNVPHNGMWCTCPTPYIQCVTYLLYMSSRHWRWRIASDLWICLIKTKWRLGESCRSPPFCLRSIWLNDHLNRDEKGRLLPRTRSSDPYWAQAQNSAPYRVEVPGWHIVCHWATKKMMHMNLTKPNKNAMPTDRPRPTRSEKRLHGAP